MLIKACTTFAGVLFLTSTAFSAPLSISGEAPQMLQSGTSMNVTYTITNNLQSQTLTNLDVQGISGPVSLVSNNCSRLPAQGTCTVVVNINGSSAYVANGIHQTLVVGKNVSPRQPAQENIDVVVSPFNLLAVGYNSNDGITAYSPLAYYGANNGADWTEAAAFTIPTGAAGTATYGLGCSTTSLSSSCVAVGYYQNDSFETFPVIYYENNNSQTWSNPMTLNAPSGGDNVGLVDVNCHGNQGQYCTAVGTYHNLANDSQAPVVYYTTTGSQTSSNWHVGTIAHEGDTSQSEQLMSVSCAGSTGANCVAVGQYTPSSAFMPIAYYSSNNGASWQLSTLNPPVGSEEGFLNGVACYGTSAQNCIAVGNYQASPGAHSSFLSYYTSNSGHSWTADTSFSLPSDAANDEKGLQSVSCTDTSGTECVAVGWYTSVTTGHTFPVAYVTHDGGLIWSLSTDPFTLPSDASGHSALNGVTCNTDNVCVTVGFYSTSAFHEKALSYTSTDGGQTWSAPVAQTTDRQLLGKVSFV